jgi:hypothetical protein
MPFGNESTWDAWSGRGSLPQVPRSPMPFGNESTWDRAHHMILIFNGQERPQNGTCPVTANHERRGRASKVNIECKLLKLSCL